jgi:hypothetical protein
MSLSDQINAGIGAHGMWKTRLQKAVADGKSEFTPAAVAVDNQCAFGKWLYGITDPQVTASAEYRECRALHRDFHALAGKVLSLAIGGNKAEAQKSLGPGGEYATLSAGLTRAMMNWKQKAL